MEVKQKNEVSDFMQNVFDIVDVVVKCLAIISILNSFVFRTFLVDGESMMETLHHKDKMVVTPVSSNKFNNGDIVVVRRTRDIPVPIIKRVIATEGQTLKIDFLKQKVYVDGKVIDEPYISTPTVPGDASIPEKIPNGYVFVMGDNRSHSTDSRFREVGLVSVDNIVGTARFTIWPWDRIGFTN